MNELVKLLEDAEKFNILLDGVREEITDSFLQFNRPTSSNEPLYKEIILTICLMLLIGDSVKVLAYHKAVPIPPCWQVIKMALNVIHNATIKPLQIRPPQSPRELNNLNQG